MNKSENSFSFLLELVSFLPQQQVLLQLVQLLLIVYGLLTLTPLSSIYYLSVS